jgi:hypothetical protein
MNIKTIQGLKRKVFRIKLITKLIITFLIGFVFSCCSSGNKAKDLTERKAVENIIRCSPDDDLNKLLKPGVTLELLPGKYRKNLDIDKDNITIRAANRKDDSTEVCFWRSTIAINNVKNVSIEGLVLRQSPVTSIQINNGSSFISIKKCKFFACNTKKVIVTLWLDQNTNNCKVENCLFDMQNAIGMQHNEVSHVYTIAIMSHQINCTDHQITGNSIFNYGYGIQLGTSGVCKEEGRHIVLKII